jgi:hypothetical protein
LSSFARAAVPRVAVEKIEAQSNVRLVPRNGDDCAAIGQQRADALKKSIRFSQVTEQIVQDDAIKTRLLESTS